jgi:hypothetical protein
LRIRRCTSWIKKPNLSMPSETMSGIYNKRAYYSRCRVAPEAGKCA